MSRSVNWDEVQAYADLLAAFYARCGHDPNDAENDDLVSTARAMVAAGGSLQ